MSTQEQIEFRQDIVELKKIMGDVLKRNLFETKEDIRVAFTRGIDHYIMESLFQVADVKTTIDATGDGGLKVECFVSPPATSSLQPVRIGLTLISKAVHYDLDGNEIDEDKEKDQ